MRVFMPAHAAVQIDPGNRGLDWEQTLRGKLARFGVQGDLQDRPIADLSGPVGEYPVSTHEARTRSGHSRARRCLHSQHVAARSASRKPGAFCSASRRNAARLNAVCRMPLV
jgi:hypothetical protein